MVKGIFSEEEKIWREFQGNKNDRQARAIKRQLEIWRKKWHSKGPVEFAEQILRVDPNTGDPLLISEDQREFLLDICKRGVNLAILSAGRGSGKSFSLAVFIAWKVFTTENYHIACMGGSVKQSKIIHNYIRGWKRQNGDLRKYTWKDIEGEFKTFTGSSVTFSACSPTSTRGDHVQAVIIDEEAAGEEMGGTKFIKAFLWTGSTSKDLTIIKSSTPHLIHGDFLETWNNAKELGYKRYRWSIAKHSSGKADPYQIYDDNNAKHWLTNVPWSSDETIQFLRKQKSNDEWLVEALGAMSISSGLVFNPDDLKACICKKVECMNNRGCRPFEDKYCPIIQYYMSLSGIDINKIPRETREALQYVNQRVMGIDWGRVSPDAYTITGKFEEFIFVLFSLELVGQNDQEKIKTADSNAKNWNLEIIRPDPREWSFCNDLADLGYSVHELFSFDGGKEKKQYLHTLKRAVENHTIIIPFAFKDLIRSLQNLTFDENGKIRKSDDHSFDSLLYAVSHYGEVMDMEHALIQKEQQEEDSPNFNPFDPEHLAKKRGDRGGSLW